MKKIILLAFGFASLSVTAQTITRNAALVKGQQLEQINEVKMNITQEMAGQSMDVKVQSTITHLIDIKNDSAGIFTVSNTLKKVLMNMDMMGQQMNFDSDKKEDLDGQLGQAYKESLDKPQEYLVNKEGVITAVKSIIETKEGGGMMDNMLGGVLETEQAGGSFHSVANIPVKGVKKGESWTDSLGDGKSKTYTTFTLQDIKGNQGLISSISSLVIDREIEQQGMKMQMDMKGTTTGEYSFEVNTGIITAKKSTTKASGNIEVMGQPVPIGMETTIITTVNKK